MEIENDIIKIADQANLKISYDAQMLSIHHKLHFKDKSIWGVAFFMMGGVFLILAPFLLPSGTTSKFLGVVTGLFLLLLAIITIIRQASDYVKIINGKILFQYNLKKKSVLIDKGLQIKMKTETITINRATAPTSSTSIMITHYLQTNDTEIPLLSFQMEDLEVVNANKLGNKITQLLRGGISTYK